MHLYLTLTEDSLVCLTHSNLFILDMEHTIERVKLLCPRER